MRARDRLGFRLALAFALVALVAVVLLATLTVLATRSEVSTLAASERRDAAAAVAETLAVQYGDAGSWNAADLAPAYAVAAANGAVVTVLDAEQGVVGVSDESAVGRLPGRGRFAGGSGRGSPVTVPVVVAGETVGSAVVGFPGSGLSRAETDIRSGLTTSVLLGAILSVLLAVAVAAVLSRRITRPLSTLGDAAMRLERGELDTRTGLEGESGEIGDLGRAFDRMASTLERESALRRGLVADVAHELRTPVTILQASCEALVDGVSEPTPETLGSLHEEVLRLGRLVGDLETLSAAEAARLSLERSQVDLSAIVAQSADRLASYFEAAELTLDRRLEPVEVVGDASRLAQVADNLLGNALKFTPAGGRVTVETRSDGHDAVLRVSDTGPGVPESEQPHLFERFWRGEVSRGVSGSGVGLAVVAELVDAHGGEVAVTSSPGEGATFTVRLPRLLPGASEPQSQNP
jgi:two-component system sensor histidine kinase BaeS